MDLQTGLVCAGLVVLSGAVLLLVSLFGIKETTYEEAIAEQRKMPDNALLLRRPVKDKSKDKKPKRFGKKVKEKKKELVSRQSSTETDDQTVSEPEHPHVTIIPEAVVLGETAPNPQSIDESKKKKKKDKVKPILVNREKPVLTTPAAEPASTSNHFEEIVPKDDLSLRKLAKTEKSQHVANPNPSEVAKTHLESSAIEIVDKVSSKEGAEKEKKAKQEKAVKVEAPAYLEKAKEVARLEDSISSSSTPVDSSPVQQSKAAKDKKKAKKSENSLQQITGDVNLQLLSTLIRKAELSRNEVQSLTDLLLNKHLDDRVDHSDWIEGRQDPVLKLRKQLAEKEEALANESASSLAFQNKLKELRAELNAERSKLAQACRTYEEGMIGKQSELQNMQSRFQQQSMHIEGEKQAFHQKIQQLNLQIKEDGIMIRKLQENGQAQGALQQELLNQRQQIQQMELHIARVSEAENTLKGQFHAVMAEREQLSGSYTSELQKSRQLEEELRDALNKLKSIEDASLGQTEVTRKLEEMERAKRDVEKKYNEAVHSAEEVNFEKTRLQGEIHQLTNKLSELQAEITKVGKDAQVDKNRLQSEITSHSNKLADTHNEMDRLKNELDKKTSAAVDEISRVVEENKCLLDEVTFFKKENERLSAELATASSVRMEKDLNQQFISHENESQKNNAAVEKLKEEAREREKLVEKLHADIKVYSTQLSNLNSEVAKFKTEISSLTHELDAQKSKNNDLRQKNWKAVDALSIAEKALENKVKETDKLVNAQVVQARLEEQQFSKEFLERLLPEVKTTEKDFKKWTASFESLAQKHLSELKTISHSIPVENGSEERLSDLETQNSHLQGLVTHYKGIIVDTEGMLNKLQKHIEEEEIRWSEQLGTKQSEIDSLKKEHSTLIDSLKSQAAHEGIEFAYNCVEKALPALLNQLQNKIKSLEDDIVDIQDERDSKVQELTEIASQVGQLRDEVTALKDKLATICNEKDALQSALDGELDRIKELNKEIVKLRSNLKIGQDSYEAEHKIRLDLEQHIKVIGCIASGDGSTAVNNAEENSSVPVERPKPRKLNWGLPEWVRKVRASSRRSKRRHTSET